ncbi:hypothetical protein OSCT_3134 [Oscillochloris trichoides DG-6]|uniref:Uncharacterized protein n=1 Tax=Oscillochloris trichoides DG-6 TaxID=765420 RepID=E1III3_9CHLR|nr:hypothetical protein OSCT_3134 [Oscillochloris trichoides DG-6]
MARTLWCGMATGDPNQLADGYFGAMSVAVGLGVGGALGGEGRLGLDDLEGEGSLQRRRVAFSVGSRGEELASQSLLDAVTRKGRQIFQDSETQRLLDYFKANASSDGPSISLRLDPRKIEVLEEFLHGTQARLGIMDRMTVAEYERHVKGFMIRHQRLLGISDADVEWLIKSREMYQ